MVAQWIYDPDSGMSLTTLFDLRYGQHFAAGMITRFSTSKSCRAHIGMPNAGSGAVRVYRTFADTAPAPPFSIEYGELVERRRVTCRLTTRSAASTEFATNIPRQLPMRQGIPLVLEETRAHIGERRSDPWLAVGQHSNGEHRGLGCELGRVRRDRTRVCSNASGWVHVTILMAAVAGEGQFEHDSLF